MHPPGADVVVVRHGEIGTKSEHVGAKMERRLRENLAAVLEDRGVDAEIEQRRFRLRLHTDEPEAATAAAADTFGVVSASPAVRVEPTLDAIRQGLADAARAGYDGGSFAVSARRAGVESAHPFSSTDIEREGGSAVWGAAEETGVEPEVDLDDPDTDLFVDCREDDALVFLEKRPGPGGLPLGTQDPVVALMSGGIDSPVAAWELMKRGAPVIPVYVDLGDYGGVDHRARAVSTTETLARYAPDRDMRLRIAPAGDAVAAIAETVDVGRMLVLRRFMFRVAAAVADDHDAVGIVTGEAIGQKSSQTTANLAVTSAAVALPVHRPLLTVDKTDITARADEIGTFGESTIPAGCERLAPDYPETRGRLGAIEEREPDDVRERARAVADRLEVVDAGDGAAEDPAEGETA
ncbi:thiamine biosynthesis protein [Halosimplex carlsbadense 2-9-1]|uniref:Probable tRNA sulfurtransferase n=1 Tax=Halosimplex carlsbadense 2-9-1 TaxID=797114 RepID=M0CRK3_9EURY|nr:tRNA sulfurtransferase [Halosimplex carlsbadense]ELZ25002.1 thiamine biosynthesis protein [Halosimplex carlsbadense 2-9-1]